MDTDELLAAKERKKRKETPSLLAAINSNSAETPSSVPPDAYFTWWKADHRHGRQCPDLAGCGHGERGCLARCSSRLAANLRVRG
jgi:hypothetical protein